MRSPPKLPTHVYYSGRMQRSCVIQPPSDLQPWYLRAPTGTATGEDFACWAAAARAAARRQGVTVHLDLYAAINPADLWRQVGRAPRPRREWKPRGWGGTD